MNATHANRLPLRGWPRNIRYESQGRSTATAHHASRRLRVYGTTLGTLGAFLGVRVFSLLTRSGRVRRA